MSDRIELSHKETLAAIAAISGLIGDVALHRVQPLPDTLTAIVDAAFAAVNRTRAGDPVGTIRRGSNGNISVRVRVFNEYELPVERWVHVSTSSGVMARSDNDYVCDWPVIFSPDGVA